MALAPGSDGLLFLPFLQGQITPKANSDARGVFSGLRMNHGVAHMTHAVYEANVFTIRDCIEVINRTVGRPESIIATGGGTRSVLCNQMKADCLDIPLQMMASENATGFGAAMIAGAAEGLFKTPEDAIDRYVERGKKYMPNPRNKQTYDEAYKVYLNCQVVCQDLFKKYHS
ncbi:xylulokinase [Pseudoramibacter faecis]|uniref:xylulokinase n=1 Tax=Pseudoramibacter faecis TaxID=3108534 RepID=UPI002E78ED49|nr:FGGY-family carbohydrate kinase [Pseudoramibacter sp. HA2172]